MSWESQVSEQILFLSPELNVFTALWRSGDRSGSKKLGIFDPPKFKGSIVQDMDVKSVAYPLTVYFDGFNHIKDGAKFFKALESEKGVWDVGHPVYGSLRLQLIDYKQVNDPTGDAAVTTFETNWLEPALPESLVSAPELGALTLLEILDAISDGILQLQQLRADLYSAVQSGLNTINRIAGISSTVMSELAATQNLINDSWNEARNTLATVQSVFQSDPSDTETQAELGQALIDVIAIPLESNDNYDIRFKFYSEMLDSILTSAPTGSSAEDYNSALFFELSVIAIMISTSRIIVTSNFKTRSEIISAIENITGIWNDSIASIDGIQENFENIEINKQYFGNSQGYTSIVNVFTLTMQFLLSQFFNLATEKRFTIKNKRSPLEVTVTEYGSADFYDLFIESNELTADEILILNPGREVVIYVP